MGRRIFVWVVLPALICLFLIPASTDLVPAWSARLGSGVHGTFTARYCQRDKAGCFWQGDFVSDDGTDRRSGVGMDDVSAVPGQRIPAVDTGDRVNVYPAGGGADWAFVTLFFVLSLAALCTWIAKVPVAAVRRRPSRQ